MTEKKYLTVAEMAKQMGISLNSAYLLTKRPGFPAVRVSPRRIVVSAAGLEEWVKRGE